MKWCVLLNIFIYISSLGEDKSSKTLKSTGTQGGGEVDTMTTKYKNDVLSKLLDKSVDQEDDEKFGRALRMWRGMDNPERFLNKTFTRNIRYLPLRANSTITPWSGHYWPLRYGLISVRYSGGAKDSQYNYAGNGTVRGNTRYISTYTFPQSINKYHQPAEHNYYSKQPDYEKYVNDYYSPSEKYDLLVGDYNFTLTNEMKAYGKSYQWTDGDISGWLGICHGWAVAAFMERRPIKPVYLRAADGVTVIKFLPDDMKALASAFWATAPFDNHMVGYRCKKGYMLNQLTRDPNTGLITDNDCFGINPGSFHLVFANQIGLRKRNLVFEPKVSNQIWNQPVVGYKSSYYNPITNRTGTLDESLITVGLAKAQDIPFLNFVLRNETDTTTKYLVGVNTTVYYKFEINPNHEKFDTPDADRAVNYTYVLQLDAGYNIIGGEWSRNEHPHYVYGALEDYATDYDKQAPYWLGSPQFLIDIGDIIKKQSLMRLPLKAIYRLMIERSRAN
jgi:hypothetical protein